VGEGLIANLSIEDTGGGVEKEIEKQIFDFFFTTKSSGQGTGIGLSMSKNIVDRFGGDIRLENRIGIGSKFIISLPIVSADHS
jgi:two-component system NtrC family sensor kinase